MAAINLRDLITAEASRQGVPPSIALAVAIKESRMCHWLPTGNVVRGSAGEVGVFQLMPATAAGLGVSPEDLEQNIRGGVRYLREMFNQFGKWDLALAAYNWGPQKLQNALTAGRPIPAVVQEYVDSVLWRINRDAVYACRRPDAYGPPAPPTRSASSSTPPPPARPSQVGPLIALGLVGGVVVMWAMS